MTGLLDIADELYARSLPDFTPKRDSLAKELKASDKDLAAAVRTLRKPSLAAWVVNLLVRRESTQVDQVLSMGVALREAQANLDGDELRALTRQRRQLTAAVTTQARALAGEAGVRVTSAVADQIEATLTAAMVDERAAAAVRSGLLVAALSATGVGEVDIAVAVPEAIGFAASAVQRPAPTRPDLHVVPDPDAHEKAVAAAEVSLEEAEGEVAEAAVALESAASEVAELEARSMQLQAEIDELKRRLSDLETAAEEVDDELSDAEDVKAEAQDTLDSLGRDRDAAAAVLARLQQAT